jgi:hypothetical protein
MTHPTVRRINELLEQLPEPQWNEEYKDAREQYLAGFDHPPAPEGLSEDKRYEWAFRTPRGKEGERINPSKARTVGYITLDQISGCSLIRPIRFRIRKIPTIELYGAEVDAWQGIKGAGIYTRAHHWEENPILAVESTLNNIVNSWRELDARSKHPELLPKWGEKIHEYRLLKKYFAPCDAHSCS